VEQYPDEKIIEIINRYRNENGITGIIKKRPVAEYATQLFENGELPWLQKAIPDYFWRKSDFRGFQLIDDANKVTSLVIVSDNELHDIEDAINKFHSKPRILKQLLKPYEKEIKKLIKKQNEHLKKIENLQEKLNKKTELGKKYKSQYQTAQKVILQLFNYSSKDKNLINLMNTGKTMTVPVKNALDNLFSLDADAFLDNTDNEKSLEKVIDINKPRGTSSTLNIWNKLKK
jgi:hypothetical protein